MVEKKKVTKKPLKNEEVLEFFEEEVPCDDCLAEDVGFLLCEISDVWDELTDCWCDMHDLACVAENSRIKSNIALILSILACIVSGLSFFM